MEGRVTSSGNRQAGIAALLAVVLAVAITPATFGQAKNALKAAAQQNDADFAAKVKEYTTDPMFLTEFPHGGA